MTLTAPSGTATARPGHPRTDPTRRTAFLGGMFYVLTFASSIPALFLLGPVLDDPGYIIGAGADTQVTFGAVLDLVNALTAIATAVVLYPVVRRRSETLALGFVTTRLFEAAVVAVGVAALLAVVALRQPGATGAEADTLVAVGRSLVEVRDATFLLGPNVMAAMNALMIGTLMFRSGLVPRIIPGTGLVGAPLLLAVTLATMFGLTEHGSPAWVLAAPIFVWELSFGVYLMVKGFRPGAVLATEAG